MNKKIKFFNKPKDPDTYLKYLRSIQAEVNLELEDKCTTIKTSGLNNLLRQKGRIDREIHKVNMIILYKKYHSNNVYS